MHNQHQHTKQCNHPPAPSLCSLMKTEKRIFIILEILGGTFILRKCCMIIPGFIMIYRMYSQIQNMVCNIPYMAFGAVNNACMSFPSFIRSFAGYLVPFLIFQYYNDKYLRTNISQENELYFNIIQIILLLVFLINIIAQPGFLQHNWTQQEIQKLQIERPELNTNRMLCFECKVPKVARSLHCGSCGGCVGRFEKHDMLINKCIGAKNDSPDILLYLQSLFIIRPIEKDIPVVVLNSYLLYFNLFEVLAQIALISHNITSYEISMFRRLSYLWKGADMDFFNPFNVGFFHNWREIMEPYFNTTKINEMIPLRDMSKDLESRQVSEDDYRELLEQRRGVYIDWSKSKYYSVMDITWSPMYFICKKELVKRDAMLKNMQQNSDHQRQSSEYSHQRYTQKSQEEINRDQQHMSYINSLQNQMNPIKEVNAVKKQEESSLLNQEEEEDI